MVLHSKDELPASGTDALFDRNSSYWTNLDWVIEAAARRGMVLALVPAWGSLVKSGQLNARNVDAYAKFLGERYRSKPNIVWIVGGDIPGDTHKEVWNALGETLKGVDPDHLITFHPFGRTDSSTWFHNDPWLDFNMFQSGHRNYAQDADSPHKYGEDNWRFVRDDYARVPVKPVIDGEPSYENIPQGLHDPKEPYWQASDVRRYAYWSVFAGAAGHTYGDNAIMQFHAPGLGAGAYGVKNFWTEALDDPGAGQMQYLKKLMLSRPYFERVPDDSVIVDQGERYDRVVAMRGKSYLFAYTYTGRAFKVRMGSIGGTKVSASWFDPRTGEAQPAGSMKNEGIVTFTPPEKGNDWVLVLDGN